MARPVTAPPQYDSLDEWVKAGKPPMSLTNKQAAKMLGMSEVHICNQVKKGVIKRPGRFIETAENFDYFCDRIGHEPQRTGGRPKRNGEPPAPPKPVAPSTTEDISAGLEAILDAISRLDLTALTPASIKKVRDLEGALKVRVERERKRGELIDRSLVSTVFGKLYQIDTNSYGTLGAKLAPDIAGMFGIEDAASVLLVEQRIEGEVFKIRAHIQRLLADFLRDVGVAAEQMDVALRGAC